MRLAALAVVVLGSACGTAAPVCTPTVIGGMFCVPDAGAPGVTLTLPLKGCTSACDKGSLACEVTVDAGTVTLELVGQSCFTPGEACPALCALISHPCAVPPLAAGDYVVASPSQSSQGLHVAAGGADSCEFLGP